jgi:hypothetical protein
MRRCPSLEWLLPLHRKRQQQPFSFVVRSLLFLVSPVGVARNDFTPERLRQMKKLVSSRSFSSSVTSLLTSTKPPSLPFTVYSYLCPLSSYPFP